MDLLLHIGMPKTGTTALQNSLSRSRKYLATRGVVYPVSPYVPDRQQIIASGVAGRWRSAKADVPDGAALDDVRRSWLAALKPTLEATSPRLVVLSTESLFVDPGDGRMSRFRDELASLGAQRIRIVAYVRQPSAQYLSAVQQGLKASHRVRPIGPPIFRAVLTRYAGTFGRENVFVRGFGKGLLAGDDIVTDFAQTYLSEFGVERSKLSDPTISNETLSAEAMWILRRYREDFHGTNDNVHARDSTALLKTLLRLDRAAGAARPCLKPGISQMVNDLAKDDLAWLEGEYGVQFPGVMAPDPMSARPEVSPDIRLEDILELDTGRLRELGSALQASGWASMPGLPPSIAGAMPAPGATRRTRRAWLKATLAV